MPQYIPPSDDAPFMYWVPGTTEAKERAEQIVRSIEQNVSVEEIEQRDEQPFAFHE